MMDGMQSSPRLPPHSLEAEQSVLGGLMLNNGLIDHVSESLRDSDFYREDHQTIYRGILSLHAAGKPSDFITLATWAKDRSLLDSVGGMNYLGTLSNDVPSAANVMAYAGVVRERAMLRRLVAAGADITDMGYNPDGRLSGELAEIAMRLVTDIQAEESDEAGTVEVGELCGAWEADLEYRVKTNFGGLSTPWQDLTQALIGLEDGDLVLVGGRSGTGKTTFALQIGEHIARTYGPVLGFSLEMPKEQWVSRLVSAIGWVELARLRQPSMLSEQDWGNVVKATSAIRELAMHFDDRAATVAQIRTRARRLQRKLARSGKRLRCVVVDYLQKIKGERRRDDSRSTEVKGFSDALKTLAKELKCPIIAISQTNRDTEKRDNRRPRLSDLSEGNIEADADIVILLYRDELVNPDSPDKGIAEAIIAKQRSGPPATVELKFSGAFSRYDDYTGPSREERVAEPAAKGPARKRFQKPTAQQDYGAASRGE